MARFRIFFKLLMSTVMLHQPAIQSFRLSQSSSSRTYSPRCCHDAVLYSATSTTITTSTTVEIGADVVEVTIVNHNVAPASTQSFRLSQPSSIYNPQDCETAVIGRGSSPIIRVAVLDASTS